MIGVGDREELQQPEPQIANPATSSNYWSLMCPDPMPLSPDTPTGLCTLRNGLKAT